METVASQMADVATIVAFFAFFIGIVFGFILGFIIGKRNNNNYSQNPGQSIKFKRGTYRGL